MKSEQVNNRPDNAVQDAFDEQQDMGYYGAVEVGAKLAESVGLGHRQADVSAPGGVTMAVGRLLFALRWQTELFCFRRPNKKFRKGEGL